MAESIVQVTEGVGKKLHTFSRVVGANTVEDEVVIVGEPYLAGYILRPGSAISVATAADHIAQVMAGAGLNVYIRSIRVWQSALATAAAVGTWALFRLSTAGTGGTVITAAQLDGSDPAAGATGMTQPTVKGTELQLISTRTAMVTQTVPTAGGPLLLAEWNFDQLRSKGLRITAGVANGVVIKNITALAAASVWPEITFSEANF